MHLNFEVPDYKRVRVILDTDCACEADDPFAVAYALMSPKLIVKGIIAEHFNEPGSMQASYDAILKLTNAMHLNPNVLHGEEIPLCAARPASEGVQFIIDEARREDDHPLYVLCLGALSNIARALREAPDIAQKLTVVTIGGRDYFEPDQDIREFNFGNDIDAANALLSSDVPVWQIPFCTYTAMRVGLAELQCRVAPCGDAGKYLFEQMVAYNLTPRAGWTAGESWALGDSPAVGVVLHNNCGKQHWQQPLRVLPSTGYGEPLPARDILVYDTIDSRYLMEDFYAKLSLL